MLSDLLPGNATDWERALAEALDTNQSVSPAIIAIRGTKLLAPPPSFLPGLIYEYGLGELTPYVPNLYELIAEGIDWQRVRGTPMAIDLSLAQHTGLAVTARRPLGRHYATTLRLLREAFNANWDEISHFGFDETFRRMWEFYLAYCEAGFATGYLDVVQLQMQRR